MDADEFLAQLRSDDDPYPYCEEETYFRFAQPFASRAIVGAIDEIRIGGELGYLFVPRLTPDAAHLEGPTLASRQAESLGFWGEVDGRYPIIAAAVVVGQHDYWDKERASQAWAHRLDEWLAVVAPYELAPWRRATGLGNYVRNAGATGRSDKNKEAFPFSDEYTPFIDLQRMQWEHVLDHVCDVSEPPWAHVLLGYAGRELSRGEHRRCVADAATAAETALAGWRVSSAPATRSGAKPRPMTLGGLIREVERTLAVLPRNIRHDLLETRNRVVHGERSVTRNEAAAAWRVASEIVHGFAPLSPCCARVTWGTLDGSDLDRLNKLRPYFD